MIVSIDMLVNPGLILQPCWKFRVTSCYCDAALLVLSACRSQGSDLRALNPPKQPMTFGIQKRDSDPNMQSTRKGKTILVRWDLCRVVVCSTLYNHVSKKRITANAYMDLYLVIPKVFEKLGQLTVFI